MRATWSGTHLISGKLFNRQAHDVAITVNKDAVIRAVVKLPRSTDGLFKQPDWAAMDDKAIQAYARDMQHRRIGAAHASDYADPVTGLTNTSDPSGNYVCGGCNKANDTKCLLVKIDKIDLATGSCNKWERKCLGDPEHDNQALSVEEAGYVVGKQPFGCARCLMQEPAGLIDELDRTLWCKRWAFTVHEKLSCCGLNNAPIKK